jgi:FkbM family methyltransferase
VELLFKVLRPLINPLLPRRPMAIRVLAGPARGMRLVIEPRTEKYYWRGGYEPAVARAMTQSLRPGRTFWDVGAHIGYTSLIGCRLVGPTGHVHAFEPMQSNLERLTEAARLNPVPNLTIHRVAVSNTDAPRLLHQGESTGMWSLVSGDSAGVWVRCVTLDQILASHGAPDLVKIDVEGAELLVLAGADRLLRQHPTLIMELLTDANRIQAEALLRGWTFERLDHHNWLLTWSEPIRRR